MAEICRDNRFELIEKYKIKLIEATNIETAKDEMAVIDNILFRFWQMGWLDKIEADVVSKREVQPKEKESEWISVEDDKKPHHLQECLIAYVFGDSTHLHYDVARYDEVYGNGYVDGPHFSNEGVDGMSVTHWMPMPKKPKEGTNDVDH